MKCPGKAYMGELIRRLESGQYKDWLTPNSEADLLLRRAIVLSSLRKREEAFECIEEIKTECWHEEWYEDEGSKRL